MNKKYNTLEDRIIANTIIDKECYLNIQGELNHCWIWIGARNSRGYSKIDIRENGKRKTMLGHRLSFSIFKSIRLFKNLIIKHECDNKLCVNPMHLKQGTQSSNIKDCVKKGRHISGFKCKAGIHSNY